MEIDVKMIYFHFFSFSSFQFQFYNVGPALVVHYPSLKCSNRHHKLGQAHNIPVFLLHLNLREKFSLNDWS